MTITRLHSLAPWRWAIWLGAAALLAAPAVAMRFTEEVRWTWEDFALLAAMLGAVGGGFEFLAGQSASLAYRGGVAIVLLAAFLLVFVNGAVGIIGDEGNSANLMFGGVLAVATIVAVHARFRAGGMARAMVAAAVAQGAVAGIALAGGMGADGPIWRWDVIGASAMFATLWLVAAWLFSRAGD